MTDLTLLIALQDVLTIMLVAHVILALHRTFALSSPSPALFLLPLLALIWGAAWSYIPTLNAMRLAPPPLGQAGVILASLVMLSTAWLSPLTSRQKSGFFSLPLLQMTVWRGIFGMSVLAVGDAGGLPPNFFWSVGLGDLAVGLFGCALLLLRKPGNALFILWNIVGVIDLTHVLILGALTLVPFFVANPQLPFVNLLPLTGVPLLLSLHVLGLRYALRK